MICPICEQAKSRQIYTFDKPELGRQISYHLHKCLNCGFGFIDGPLSSDILDQVYGSAFHNSTQQNAMILGDGQLSPSSFLTPIILNAQQRVEMLKNLKLSGRLLDIGAGKGFFVKVASHYFDAEGIELSQSAVETGCQMGIDLRQGDFLHCDLTSESYQVVTLWDVLASLPQPRIAIERIHQVLSPAGHLVMTLPDFDSFIARRMGKFWPLMIPPINLGYYTTKSVESLLNQTGFEVLSIQHQEKWVTVDFLTRKLFKTVGIKPPELLPIPPDWKCAINLGDIMTVIAMKRVNHV